MPVNVFKRTCSSLFIKPKLLYQPANTLWAVVCHTVLSIGFVVKPSRRKLRQEEQTKLDYLTRDTSHPSYQIEFWKEIAHEHLIFPCVTHIVNRSVLQQCGVL